MPVPLLTIFSFPMCCAGSTNTKYTLFAVVNHMGTNQTGHYTAWCNNDLKWNLFNDSK